MTRGGLKKSQAQEKALAAKYQGVVNPGSGNGWLHKNDVRSARFSFEAKTTEKKSYSLRLDDLLKAERNALISGREMVFAVELGGRNWMVISQETFDTLLDA
ncbi:hypothetical protein ADL22_12270 [Streptomyces sp. NRRL F-4489]|uniref:hypothetical protein n=1 Tax=Streptomyces sp. NRRL F-4489 TaxID=1609095 RepID=UPI00074B0313|nr:hypothetical protein [Streptomyces sp. NRRL F-4489]KUL44712.1 hypothetical protein ADL22_12270 [Streptomyces sp. NRRL F-4489]